MTPFIPAGAALLLATIAGLLAPLLRRPAGLPSRAQFDRAVYRDQLAELARDVARGVLAADEAQAARLEIQRRLLAADTTETTATAGRSPRLAAAAALLVAGAAGGLYWQLGAPFLPDTPFAARPAEAAQPSAAAHSDMRDAAQRLEAKLKENPPSADGWLLYARTESMLGDWAKAQMAYRRALDLGLKTADVYGGLGEMLVMQSDGVVAPAARDAFVSALAAQPKNEVARFYLALADAQAGDARAAIAGWLSLAADVPEDSPMREEIARRVAESAASAGIVAPALPKVQPAQVEAADPQDAAMQQAASLPPAEREKMIAGMIEKLATRLQTEPGDLDGWLRLGRAYAVQGEAAKAADAYEHAIALAPTDSGVKLQAAVAMFAPLEPSDPLPARGVALLREVAVSTPEAPEVLWYLGVVAAREGRPDEAKGDWSRLLDKLPPGGDDYKMVAAALQALKPP